jgi:hypothetical protein
MGPVAIVPTEVITSSILLLRGQKVLLDRDLAALYQVETRVLVQAVQRNLERFPDDFMFRLTKEELERVNSLRSQFVISNDEESDSDDNLRSQIVISSSGHGGARYLPYAFTEQGVAMLSSVLRSERAVQVNIEIMRAFVRLRHLLRTNENLARRLDEFEEHYDEQFEAIWEAIRELITPATGPRRQLGFAVATES